ncbi:DNA ligase LigA-related protein [Burkholderia sp. DN3021]|uniref:DNA ligase LigA-related protein n=1 Tax=Burkholderia sp. DN3021 TaxID=3410137 RepID=UPI003C7DFA03
MTLNQKFVQYLMSSYLYYEEGRSVLSDTEFDALCKELLERWDEITHRHKDLTTREDLEAGTGYAIKYPSIVVGAARHWWYANNPQVLEARKPTKRTRATRRIPPDSQGTL